MMRVLLAEPMVGMTRPQQAAVTKMRCGTALNKLLGLAA